MKILIQSILQSDQRYATVGDYQWINGDLHINVSEFPNKNVMYLIAIHELVEALLCDVKDISIEDIDKWDIDGQFDTEEPGDDHRAPYFVQHQIATAIEKLCAFEMDVSWVHYEFYCQELLKDSNA